MASKSGNAENGSAPATPKAGGGGYSTLTPREQEILAKAMTCLKTAPEIDFPRLAAVLDMKNPRSAVNAWSTIKKKMDWTLKAPSSPAVVKAPAGGKRKKPLATEEKEEEEEEEEKEEDSGAPAKQRAKVAQKPRKKVPATPKKGKVAAAPKAPVAVEYDSDEGSVKSEDQADAKDSIKSEEEVSEV